MSFNTDWDPDKYREDHESDEHWELRRAFMVRWKNNYPEERLVCLARVFTNMEFMGCRYPPEIMQEVAGLSQEVAQAYRNSRKTKLQRTFVSASTAAEDRAKGVKREGGVVTETPPSKSARIDFVPQGQKVEETVDSDNDDTEEPKDVENKTETEKSKSEVIDANEYLNDMAKVRCLDVREFQDRMFQTGFGRMVLLIRPWASKLWNIQASCQVCGVNLQSAYENGCFSLTMNGKLVARATGDSKAEAKSIVEVMAWNRLKEEAISILVKEQWIAQNGSRISVDDVTGRCNQDNFGEKLDSSVAAKMMKLMGWKGGGLGADAQGIAEPIQPNLQMVNRAGLGSSQGIAQLRRAAQEMMRRYIASDTLDVDLVFSVNRAGLGSSQGIAQLRRAAQELMRRYIASDTLDVDLVFSSEFSKEERAQLHQIAQRAGLASRSYGDKDRFLVVKKKLDPFSLARAVIEKGGITPKYQVFIPIGLRGNER